MVLTTQRSRGPRSLLLGPECRGDAKANRECSPALCALGRAEGGGKEEATVKLTIGKHEQLWLRGQTSRPEARREPPFVTSCHLSPTPACMPLMTRGSLSPQKAHSIREQNSRSQLWAWCPLPSSYSTQPFQLPSPTWGIPNLQPCPLPTSGVGGHVSHFLEGIQEGHSSQHSGPGEMDSGMVCG